MAASLTVGYVPGATPAKWARVWAQRRPDVPLRLVGVPAAEAAAAVRAGELDLAVLRVPTDTTGLAVIGLYDEQTVVVAPTDHLVAATDEVAPDDLADEPVLLPRDDVVGWSDAPGVLVDHRPETTADAIELVAAGTGVLLVPQSLARLHHRRDLIYRPVMGAPACAVALALREDAQSEAVGDFVGVVRGRRPGSSRARAAPPPKRTAREKTLAKQAARAAAGKVARTPGAARRGWR